VGYEVFRDERLAGKASEPRFTDDHLRPWSRHCYAVQAYDASGQRSARSPLTCAQTKDETPPTEPRALKAEVRGVDAVALTWQASTDDDEVDLYQVSRGDKVITTGKTIGLVEPGLAPAKEYCYSVRAIDRAGNRSTPAGPACVVVPDITAPTVPTKVTATADGEHAISIGWGASKDDVGVARYEVATDGEARRTIGSLAQTTTREGGLAVATRHCYFVRACDAAGNCSAWTPPACATTPDLTPPTPPPSPAAVAESDAAIEVRWGASTDNLGVTGYEVLRGDVVVARTEAGTSARDAGLQPAKQYCYTVRARDLAGNTSTSAKACATTPDVKPPTAPGRPAAVPVSSTQVFVAWDPSTDDVAVAGYEVYRDGSLVAKVAATRAREHRLEPSHKYCYTVRAFDAAGNRSGAAGPFCTVTTAPAELSAPSDLRVRRVSRTNILLQWEPSESKGVVYRIYAQGDRLAGLTAGNTFTPSGTFGAEPNCFRVAALDTNDRESQRSNEVCATPVEDAHSTR
jgi:chitodextrinase